MIVSLYTFPFCFQGVRSYKRTADSMKQSVSSILNHDNATVDHESPGDAQSMLQSSEYVPAPATNVQEDSKTVSTTAPTTSPSAPVFINCTFGSVALYT